MPVQINIKLDAKKVSKAIRELGRKGVVTAANQALNRTLTGVRTDATRFLADKAQVKRKGAIRKKFKMRKSTPLTLRAHLITPPTNLALSNQKGVRVVGRKGNKRVQWRGKRLKAFRIKGQVGVLKDDLFIRVEGRKSPVRAYSYTLLQEYRKHRAHDHLTDKAFERLDKAFDAAFKNQMRRRGF